MDFIILIIWFLGALFTFAAIIDFHDIYETSIEKCTTTLLFIFSLLFAWPLVALYALVTYPNKLRRDKIRRGEID